MNAKKIIVTAVLLTFVSGSAAEAFPFFGSNYGYGDGYGNYGGWGGHCHHHRHHHHRRGW